MNRLIMTWAWVALAAVPASFAQEWWKPYSPPCTERENVFEFTEKPAVKLVGKDRYEITFAVKGYCDVTVAIVDPDPTKELVKGRGIVVRHLASGVLGPNAPEPFQKNSLRQTLYWNGKDDLDIYHKTPEKLQVRVMLGLKPEFDKRLGGTSGNNLPGFVWGLAIGEDGAYVFVHGNHRGHLFIRKFDHDGKYIHSLAPPPANLPESKMNGRAFIEYEPGKRAPHGAEISAMTTECQMFIQFAEGATGGFACQPALAGGRLFWLASAYMAPPPDQGMQTRMVYLYTDGSTDVKGLRGRSFAGGRFDWPCFAVSPDQKTLYITGGVPRGRSGTTAVLRCSADGDDPAAVFVGHLSEPGTDNTRFQNAVGLDCDASGRLYVADKGNNRIQVFSPDGKFLKTIPVDRPQFLRIHAKTGAIYVLHEAREQGKTVGRLTKFNSFDKPQEEFHVNNIVATAFALDSWTPKPRLWLAGEEVYHTTAGLEGGSGPSVRIYEERDRKLVQILDFDEVAREEGGASYFGRFHGAGGDQRGHRSRSTCDPTREKLYSQMLIFDLRTGAYEGQFQVNADDAAFDKKGYLHQHPGSFPTSGVVHRQDPQRAQLVSSDGAMTRQFGYVRGPIYRYPEVPYDYGEAIRQGARTLWTGAIVTKCQASAHEFQHGMGVNMRGDIIVCSRISYVPRMEDAMLAAALAGPRERVNMGMYVDAPMKIFEQRLREALRQGDVYFLPRQPGVPVSGDTIWVYDATGEQRYGGYAAVIGGRLAGVQMDEDRNLYFTVGRPRMVGGTPFLEGKGGTYGLPDDKKNRNPFMGTFVKARPSGVKALLKNAPVPLDQPPARPPDLGPAYSISEGWIEGAEWFYAGVGPVVYLGCECPSSRPHLDWFKRSFVPEPYRHSIGVLDTNGNLILHIGRYGNFDSALGNKSLIPVGGDNIGITYARYIGGTDNYLAFEDWGERLVVLRLNYHAEEVAQIRME